MTKWTKEAYANFCAKRRERAIKERQERGLDLKTIGKPNPFYTRSNTPTDAVFVATNEYLQPVKVTFGPFISEGWAARASLLGLSIAKHTPILLRDPDEIVLRVMKQIPKHKYPHMNPKNEAKIEKLPKGVFRRPKDRRLVVYTADGSKHLHIGVFAPEAVPRAGLAYKNYKELQEHNKPLGHPMHKTHREMALIAIEAANNGNLLNITTGNTTQVIDAITVNVKLGYGKNNRYTGKKVTFSKDLLRTAHTEKSLRWGNLKPMKIKGT